MTKNVSTFDHQGLVTLARMRKRESFESGEERREAGFDNRDGR